MMMPTGIMSGLGRKSMHLPLPIRHAHHERAIRALASPGDF
jgi:hypothetical protein